ncbi:hypothetical protein GCM10010412_092050 [Nonomuraea recticatena]|uniref:Uncharacterized protein n=1 Tax=Nonomuraea recticatena TaxID=46178 RepID=A0ABP6FQA5_9ACTN
MTCFASRIKWQLLRCTAVLASLLVFAAWSAAPAHADSAEIRRSLWMTGTPNAGNWASTAIRSIWLRQSTYEMRGGLFQGCTVDLPCQVVQRSESRRSIDLAAGWYSWGCSVGAVGGTGSDRFAYRQQCFLTPEGIASPTATLVSDTFVIHEGTHTLIGRLISG